MAWHWIRLELDGWRWWRGWRGGYTSLSGLQKSVFLFSVHISTKKAKTTNVCQVVFLSHASSFPGLHPKENASDLLPCKSSRGAKNSELEPRGITECKKTHCTSDIFKRNFASITGAISAPAGRRKPKQDDWVSDIQQIAATHTSYRYKDDRSHAKQGTSTLLRPWTLIHNRINTLVLVSIFVIKHWPVSRAHVLQSQYMCSQRRAEVATCLCVLKYFQFLSLSEG